MFHTKKPGKYVVDVCTNLSCCLWGAEDLLAYLEQKLGLKVGRDQRHLDPARDRVPRLLRHRALPADQRGPPRESPVARGGGRSLRQARSLPRRGSRRCRWPPRRSSPGTGDARLLDPRRLPGQRRLPGAGEGAGHAARPGHRRGEEEQPARPRRRRLPHRDEVELRPQGQPQAQVPGGERRRVRAGHLQGPLHPRERPAHAARGHRHRLLRRSACTPPTSTCAASSTSRPSGCSRPSTRRTGRASSARRCWAGTSRSTSTWSAAPARTSAAKRPGCSSRSRARRAGPGSSRPSPRWSGSSAAPPW